MPGGFRSQSYMIGKRMDYNRFQINDNYEHKLLVCGYDMDYEDLPFPDDEVYVYNSTTNIWRTYKPTGVPNDLPIDWQGAIIGEKFYVIPFHNDRCYVLDLRAFHWHTVMLSGEGPQDTDARYTWLWKEKIYIFGVEEQGPSNRLIALNTVTEAWEWQTCFGEPPSRRKGHACALSGDFVLVFGGDDNISDLNDLYALHMPTHTWTSLQDIVARDNESIPDPRSFHVLKSAGKNKAFLVGVAEANKPPPDAWVLTWSVTGDVISQVKWNRISKKIDRGLQAFRFVHVPNPSRISYCYFSPCADRSFTLLGVPETLYEASYRKMIENKVKCNLKALFGIKCRKRRRKSKKKYELVKKPYAHT